MSEHGSVGMNFGGSGGLRETGGRRGLIGLTPEQLLIIADEVCHQHHCTITNFSALCAASAVTTAAISGIDIHGGDPASAEHELARVILALKPLNKANHVLAAIAVEVFHQVNV